MINAVFDHRLFSPYSGNQIVLDFSSLDDVQLQFEDILQSVDIDQLTANLTSVASSEIVWAYDSFNGPVVLSLAGSGIDPVSTAQQLEDAVNAGTANGTLTNLSLSVGGAVVASVQIGPSALTIDSGIHSVTLQGLSGQSLENILQLTQLSLSLGTVLDASEADFNAAVQALSNFGLTGVSFAENGQNLISLAFGGAGTFASLTVLDYTATIEGALETNFGALLTAVKSISDAGDDASSVDTIAIDGFRLVAPNGDVLIRYDGDINTVDDATVQTVVIEGSSGDDSPSLGYYSSQGSFEINENLYEFGLFELQSDLTDGDFDLRVELGAGYDWLDVRGSEIAYHQQIMGGDSRFTYDGGSEVDMVSVEYYGPNNYFFNPYSFNDYYAALNEFYATAPSQSSVYDMQGFQNAETAWLQGEGSRPALADFLNDGEQAWEFDQTGYDAQMDAVIAELYQRFGTVATQFPFMGDGVTSDYALSDDPADYLDEFGFPKQPFDYSLYQAAYNVWAENGFIGSPPSISDFPAHPDLYDYASYNADRDSYDAFYANRPTAYTAINPQQPQLEDFPALSDTEFDYDGYNAAVETFNENYSEDQLSWLVDGVREEDFRTSPLESDYDWFSSGDYNSIRAYNYDGFFNQGISDPTAEDYIAFRQNEDLYDHESMEAAFAYTASEQMAYYDNRPDTQDFLLAGTLIQVDFSQGVVSGFDDKEGTIEAFSFDLESVEGAQVYTNGDVDVIGSEGNDRYRIADLFAESIEFDGAGGTDRVQFHRTTYNYEPRERGFTQESFEAAFDLLNRTDGSIDIAFKDGGGILASLKDVEEIEFLQQEGSSERVVVDLQSLLPSGLVLGTEQDDILTGSLGDDTVQALGGADFINGLGGSDLFEAGAGNDTIVSSDGESTVDGGLGTDTMVAFASAAEHATAQFNEADGETGIQFRALAEEGDTTALFEINASSVERLYAGVYQTAPAGGVETNGTLAVTGDANDNVFALEAPVRFLSFDGADGEDQFQLHAAWVENDTTFGLTQAEFEQRFYMSEDAETGEAITWDAASGTEVARLKDVETVTFAYDPLSGTPEPAPDALFGEVFETVQIADLNFLNIVTDGSTLDGSNTSDDFYRVPDSNGSPPAGPIQTGAGNDRVIGGDTGDNVDGGDDNDSIDGGQGNDTLNGGNDNDTLNGGAGEDELNGGNGDDVLNDGIGADIEGGEGNDIGVTAGGDNTFSDDGTAVPVNNEINDFYCGGYGDDVFDAGFGNDILIGDANSGYYFGDDRLDGGNGIDLMYGGFNADVFVFEAGDSTATAGDTNNANIMGADVIGQFDINSVFDVLYEAGGARDITDARLAPQGPDFQIGIDMIELAGFTDPARQTAIRDAFDDGSLISDVSGSGQFESDGIRILFSGVSEAQLEAVQFDDVFMFS